jgi:putative ABC transport system permease protein
MVFAGDNHQLVSVKAVARGRLRGELRVAPAPFEQVWCAKLPPPGAVWLDSCLFPALGIVVATHHRRRRRLASLRCCRTSGSAASSISPRVLMHIDDVPRTEVVRPGSRIFIGC